MRVIDKRLKVNVEIERPTKSLDQGHCTSLCHGLCKACFVCQMCGDGAGTPDNILLVGFKNDSLKPLTGKTLAEIAQMRGTDQRYTAMDLISRGALL